jgi:hypothetical protein
MHDARRTTHACAWAWGGTAARRAHHRGLAAPSCACMAAVAGSPTTTAALVSGACGVAGCWFVRVTVTVRLFGCVCAHSVVRLSGRRWRLGRRDLQCTTTSVEERRLRTAVSVEDMHAHSGASCDRSVEDGRNPRQAGATKTVRRSARLEDLPEAVRAPRIRAPRT